MDPPFINTFERLDSNSSPAPLDRFELENEYNIDSDDSDDGNTTIDEGSDQETPDETGKCVFHLDRNTH